MGQSNRITLVVLFLSLITLYGCQDLVPRDTQSLFFPGLQRSEIFGFLAGFGTTFAAVPDLVSMLKRRSRAGMYPMMAAIMGTFSDPLGLLRFIDCIPTGDCMERGRGFYKFLKRWCIFLFHPQRKSQIRRLMELRDPFGIYARIWAGS